LNQVSIDAAAGTAVTGAGARWRDVVEAAAPHGHAPLSGSTSGLGAVGFCLGGGKGWLVRRFGLAADSVEVVDIVTADGQLRRVDRDTEPDLFWAVCGGGPNFGVVTALTIRLVPAAEVYAGGLYWPVGQARPVLSAFRELTRRVPAEVTAQCDVLHLPPDPMIPEPMRGNSFVRVALCSVGDPDETDRLLAPLRAIPGRWSTRCGRCPTGRSTRWRWTRWNRCRWRCGPGCSPSSRTRCSWSSCTGRPGTAPPSWSCRCNTSAAASARARTAPGWPTGPVSSWCTARSRTVPARPFRRHGGAQDRREPDPGVTAAPR
jgi:hypothetical protein